jgi:hypothetical protein
LSDELYQIAYGLLVPRKKQCENLLVPVTVHHRGGEKTLIINQRKRPPIDGATISLGIFTFGESGTVQVSNKGTDGYGILDAAQFFPVSK